MSRSPRVTARACWLGSVPYRDAWDLQAGLVAAVRAGAAPGTLLLLEHPHVYTLGRRGGVEHVLWDEARRSALGVDLVASDRGGDVTYHGPGQLVGYPIFDLCQLRLDLVSYIRALETSLIASLATLGVEAAPGGPGLTGVWARGEKVAAIGVKMSDSVVSHGFALNLTTDLVYFDGIVGCGLAGRRATSVARLTGVKLEAIEVARAYARHFEDVFATRVKWVTPETVRRSWADIPATPREVSITPS